MLNVILAKNFLAGADYISSSGKKWVAIETEYGTDTLDTTHPEVVFALNHHGNFQTNSAPSMAYEIKTEQAYDNFIVSHIDLDTLYGMLWMAGWLKITYVTKQLANIIAYADIYGFHRVGEILKTEDTGIIDRYYSIGYLVNSWTINDDGLEVKDISKEVHKLLLKIKDIILQGASEEQILSYKRWIKQKEKTSKKYIQNISSLCNNSHFFIYKAPFSLTTAYDLGEIHADIILQYNEQSKSITLCCYDADIAQKYFGNEGVILPLQQFFGREAGGKKEIGGTSRNQNVEYEMIDAFYQFLVREYFNIPEITTLGETHVSNHSD